MKNDFHRQRRPGKRRDDDDGAPNNSNARDATSTEKAPHSAHRSPRLAALAPATANNVLLVAENRRAPDK